MASDFRRAGPLILARLFTAMVTLSIPLVLARALSLVDYGAYKQLFLIAQALTYVLPFGVAQSLYYFVPRSRTPRPFVTQTLVFLTLAGLLGLAVTVSVAPGLARWFSNPEILRLRWPLGVYLFGCLGSYPLEVGLTSLGRTKASALCYLGSDTARAVCMTVPILAGFGLAGMLTAMAIFSLIRWAATWLILVLSTEGTRWERNLWRGQLAYALPFGAAVVIATITQYAHQFAVSSQVAPGLFAIYAVGCFQLPLVDLLYTPTSELIMVRLGELGHAVELREGARIFREAVARLAVFFIPAAAFLWVCAPEFIHTVFGSKFLPATPLFRVSALGIVLAVFPVDAVLRARNRTGRILWVQGIKALATIPALWVGLSKAGMLGAVCAWAVVEVLGKGLLLWQAKVALRPGLREDSRSERLIPWGELGRSVGAAIVGGTLLALFEPLLPGREAFPKGTVLRATPLLGACALFLAAYVAGLRAMGGRLPELGLLPGRRIART